MADRVNLGHFHQRAMRGDGRLVMGQGQDGAEKVKKGSGGIADFFRRVFKSGARRQENVQAVRQFKQELVRQFGAARVTPDIAARLDGMMTQGKSLRAGAVRDIMGRIGAGGTRAPAQCGKLFAAMSGKKPDMTAFAKELTGFTARLQTNPQGDLVSSADLRDRTTAAFRADLQGMSPGALLQLANSMKSPEFLQTKEGMLRQFDAFAMTPTKDARGVQVERSLTDVKNAWEGLEAAVLEEIEARGLTFQAGVGQLGPNDPIPLADAGALSHMMDAARTNGDAMLSGMCSGLLRRATGGGDTLDACMNQFKGMREATGFGRTDRDRVAGFEAAFRDTVKGEIRKMMREDPGAAAKLAMFSSALKNDPTLAGKLDGMKNQPPPPPGLSGDARGAFVQHAEWARTLALDVEFFTSCIDEVLDTGEGGMLDGLNHQEFTEHVGLTGIPDPGRLDGVIGEADVALLKGIFSHQFLKDVNRQAMVLDGVKMEKTAPGLKSLRQTFIARNGGDVAKADQQLRNLTLVLSQSLDRGFLDPAMGSGKIPTCSVDRDKENPRSFTVTSRPDGTFEVKTTLVQHLNGLSDETGRTQFLDSDKSVLTCTSTYVISAGNERDGQIGVVMTSGSVTASTVPQGGGKVTEYKTTYPAG